MKKTEVRRVTKSMPRRITYNKIKRGGSRLS